MVKMLSKLKWFLPVIVTCLLLLADAGIVIALFAGIAGGTVLWWVGKAVKPEGELPNGAVSCCHYLGEDGDE